jgi:phosphate starvation-inducible PhoH-like protein
METIERVKKTADQQADDTRIEVPLKKDELYGFVGVHDRNLKVLRVCLRAKITASPEAVIITGKKDEAREAQKMVQELVKIVRQRGCATGEDVETVLRAFSRTDQLDAREIPSAFSTIQTPQKLIHIRSSNQEKYYKASRANDIVFAIGPAGTGKTYLAVAMAVQALTNHEVKKIILCRPAVEAGENLGFLPGDLKEKVDPYFRPLYDALMEMMPLDRLKRLIERHTVEVAPLAYMRGRTLADAYAILDEAQNTTTEQMMMFLTRLGARSKAVITGDVTQIDLPNKEDSGLLQAPRVLSEVEGIDFTTLNEQDAVRHELVRKIITAYNEYQNGAEKMETQ